MTSHPVCCEGEFTKNGKDALQPIRPELAEMLRPWLIGKATEETVFTMPVDAAAEVVRADLEAAGIDSTGFDFHALRHSYITILVKSGASVKVCQALARHADPKLTMNMYTHLGITDLADGLQGLAHILPTTRVSKGLTGTDGTTAISSPGRPLVDPTRQAGKLIAPMATSPVQHREIAGARQRFRTVTDCWRLAQ